MNCQNAHKKRHSPVETLPLVKVNFHLALSLQEVYKNSGCSGDATWRNNLPHGSLSAYDVILIGLGSNESALIEEPLSLLARHRVVHASYGSLNGS